MIYLSYLYTIGLVVSQFIYAAIFVVFRAMTHKKIYFWCACLSATLALDDLLFHMAKFLPNFAIFYISCVTHEPLCRSVLIIAYLIEYRMILLHSLHLPLRRFEPAMFAALICVIPLVSFSTLTPLYNFLYNSFTWAYTFYTFYIGIRACPYNSQAPQQTLYCRFFLITMLVMQIFYYLETIFWIMTGYFPIGLLFPSLSQFSILSLLISLLLNCASLAFLAWSTRSLCSPSPASPSLGWPSEQIHVTCAPFKLTSREEEIVFHLMEHRKITEIAQALYISPGTVKAHVHNILVKIDVPNQDKLREKLEQLRSH